MSNGKWSKEKCATEYIRDRNDMTLEKLALISGRSIGALSRWSSEGSWTKERKRFLEDVEEKTREKTIEKISDLLSETYVQIAFRHFSDYKKVGDIAMEIFEYQENKLKEAKEGGQESYSEAIARIDASSLNQYSVIMDRSRKGEANSVGLKYEIEEHAAIEYASKNGYSWVEQDYLRELIEINQIKPAQKKYR